MRRQPRVMFSFKEPQEQANPYVRLLVSAVQPHVSVEYFSWTTLITRRPDILHVQWPEAMVHDSSRLRSLVKSVVGCVLLLTARARGTRIVLTVHNLSAHEAQPAGPRQFIRLVNWATAHRIYINSSAENPSGPNSSTVLHGSFREWYGAMSGAERGVEGTGLLLFGMLRPYKGVEALVAAHKAMPASERVPLRICGVPANRDYANTILTLTNRSSDVSVTLGHLSDAGLRREIAACRLVVLPYRKLYNSGAVIAALGIGRPLLLPRSASTESLVAEFGSDWIALFDNELTSGDIEDALKTTSRSARLDLPDMSRRDWQEAGAAHADIYAALTHT